MRRPGPSIALLLATVLAGCGSPPSAPAGTHAPSVTPAPSITAAPSVTSGPSVAPRRSASPSTAETSWRAVALGDSVTAGTNCDCTAFPTRYADQLSELHGVPVSMTNEGAGGLTSAGLLAELDHSSSDQAQAVAAADIDLVTIGANDFSDHHGDITTGRCPGTGSSDCVEDELTLLSADLTAILRRIRTLRSGHRTAVLVTGYWNVFEDGQVARSHFPDLGLAATQALTRQANAVIHRVTLTAGDTYVDLYAPFNGPEAGGDVTSLLADDGDHPNARGHALIARRLIAAGVPGLA